MQNRKQKPESDCGNYPATEFDYETINPHYESVNPKTVKHNKRHSLMYIVDWGICLFVAGIAVTFILNAC